MRRRHEVAHDTITTTTSYTYGSYVLGSMYYYSVYRSTRALCLHGVAGTHGESKSCCLCHVLMEHEELLQHVLYVAQSSYDSMYTWREQSCCLCCVLYVAMATDSMYCRQHVATTEGAQQHWC